MKFRVGNRVKWSSQSQGFAKKKVGKIILLVPAGEDPAKLINSRIDLSKYATDMRFGGARLHDSYLVEVPRRGEKRNQKPALYFPRVCQLKAAR